jgi:ribosome biogenesis GTPase / thiamine phosphate phosphatase
MPPATDTAVAPPEQGVDDGLVTSVYNQFATVLLDGEERQATIAGRLRHARPVVGDRVELRETPDGSLRIESVRERHGTLIRTGFRGREQVVAANVDLLVIVAAVTDPPLRPRLIDRYLVAAWRGGIEPALALTKADLPHDQTEVEQVRRLMRQLGHAVIDVSIPLGEGIDRVRELIGTRTAVLAGHSGVGKTTLSNAVTGRRDAVQEVNAVVGRGRHTTTLARWIPLEGGGALIDTAGIRSYGIAGIDPERLQEAFPEILEAARDCRYHDCLHEEGEEGCAVPGRVSEERLDSYRTLLAELREEAG